MTDGRDQIRASFEDAEDVDLPEGMVPDAGMPGGSGGGSSQPPPRDSETEEPPESRGAELSLNDTGNARRLELYCGEDLRFVPRVGWLVWDGCRWVVDDDEILVRRRAQTVQDRVVAEVAWVKPTDTERRMIEREAAIRAELKAIADEAPGEDMAERQRKLKAELAELKSKLWGRGSTRQRHLTFAKSAGNTGAIKNMMTEATVALARHVDDLDRDPLSVNTESGLLRFSTEGGPGTGFSKQAGVRLDAHSREVPLTGRDAPMLITHMIPSPYDPDAAAPTFEAFLRRVQPDPAMRAFLQRWFGLSLSGLKIQKFAFLYGNGANGKSVLVDLIARLLEGYAHSAKIESFTGHNRRRGGEATPDIFPLIWARMVRTSEPEEGERLQEGLIKEITGGEAMLVRKLHGDFIEREPFFKLTMSGNHKPEIRGIDDGIWRRVLLIPFEVTIPKEDRDPHLGEKLWAERAGVLNWLVQGLLDYLEGGLQEPPQVLAAIEEYRADSDPVGQFLETACEITGDPSHGIESAELGRAFNLWAALNGHNMWTPNTIGRRLNDRSERHRGPNGEQFTRIKSGVKKFIGIRLESAFRREFDYAPRDAKGQPVPRRDGGDPGVMDP